MRNEKAWKSFAGNPGRCYVSCSVRSVCGGSAAHSGQDAYEHFHASSGFCSLGNWVAYLQEDRTL